MIIHRNDNVEIREDKMKYALCDIEKGAAVVKYGFPIGITKSDIKKGEMVGPHNLSSALSGSGKWEYKPIALPAVERKEGFFEGYRRADGTVGIRNDIWIIPTVGCANGAAKKLAEMSGAKALTHQFGCSQLGDDFNTTRKLLAGLVRHPNAGGVLVIGLGCENNNISVFKESLGDLGGKRVRFMNLQEVSDEIEEGMKIINDLKAEMASDKRELIPISELKIGIKCGGSDGYSGITANPLVGRVSERFYERGSGVYMTEIPEIFGAEEILLSRCVSRSVFDKVSSMINSFREYFISHGEGIAENPSPGNIAGGITTLEEKSLGCVQKGGNLPVVDALSLGDTASGDGLFVVDGPGNDQCAVTNLAAAGVHMILFTTGRGTPLSAPVPTLKISTNTPLAKNKPHWIDFDAGVLLEGADMDNLANELFDLCVNVAGGKSTIAEENTIYDIAIFKNGVTL